MCIVWMRTQIGLTLNWANLQPRQLLFDEIVGIPKRIECVQT